MGIVVAILISGVSAVAKTILWLTAMPIIKNDPEWQEHKDDPDYWEWP